VAILFTASIAAVLVTLGDLGTLADTTVLLLLFVFVFVNISVLVLRRDPLDHEHFHAPSVLPVIGVVVSLGLIVQKAFDDPSQFLYGGGLVALGIVLALITRLTQGPPREPLDPAALGD
jgi:basic amino acid/polyamine antiporter, APA family